MSFFFSINTKLYFSFSYFSNNIFPTFNHFLTILLFISDSQISKYNVITLFKSKGLPRCLILHQSYKYFVLENLLFSYKPWYKSLFWYNIGVFTPLYHSKYNFKIFIIFYLVETIIISFCYGVRNSTHFAHVFKFN